MTLSPQSVIVLGGLSCPIGNTIIDRLISQRYGVCVVDVQHNGVCGKSLPGPLLNYHHYDPGLPGDFDFVVRDSLRKNANCMKFIAIIDLGCVRAAGQGGYDPLPTLVPDIGDCPDPLIYIIVHSIPVCLKKLSDLEKSRFCHHTYLVQIPNLVLMNSHAFSSDFHNKLRAIQTNSSCKKIVWVSDIARLVCDHLLRNPIVMKGPVIRIQIEGHSIVKSIPLDLLVILEEVENEEGDIRYDNVECLFQYKLTDLSESLTRTSNHCHV